MDHELSNAPVVDLDRALDPASLAAWVEFSYAGHAAAIDALLTRFDKFTEVTASGIADDFVAGHAADFAKDLKAAAGALDETRARIKKPVLHAQRLIDGSAKALSDRVAWTAVREARGARHRPAYLKVKEAEASARSSRPGGSGAGSGGRRYRARPRWIRRQRRRRSN